MRTQPFSKSELNSAPISPSAECDSVFTHYHANKITAMISMRSQSLQFSFERGGDIEVRRRASGTSIAKSPADIRAATHLFNHLRHHHNRFHYLASSSSFLLVITLGGSTV